LQGFLLTSSLSSGFSGLTTSFVEHVRDEFPKAILWATGMLENSRSWTRSDSEVSSMHPFPATIDNSLRLTDIGRHPGQRSKAQRMLNEALGLVALEDFATMVLPIQPVTPWQLPADLKEGELRILPGQDWRRYVRDDVSSPFSPPAPLTPI
jgi:hypothetical protein